jgi:predicted HTH transcriptional regulator
MKRMTRTYALRRLLEHGPLTAREIREIARWSLHATHTTLECLVRSGVVTSIGGNRNRSYALQSRP